ncbi:MAG: peptidase [Nitrosopumilus sp.]
MKIFVIVLLVITVSMIFVGTNPVYAHKAQVVGDFKINVGWKTEPPIANEQNTIEVIFSIASDFDKQRYDITPLQSSTSTSPNDITGLAEDLEVQIRIGNGNKETITFTENSEIPGTYYGDYTPSEAGLTKINLYGKIKGSEFEASFNPEKVQEGTKNSLVIPDWIRNNAKWWSEGTIGDSDFVSGIQYLIKENILKIPPTAQGASSSNEIPAWIKNNAGWWAEGMISDDDFVKGIQYMITNGIISV